MFSAIVGEDVRQHWSINYIYAGAGCMCVCVCCVHAATRQITNVFNMAFSLIHKNNEFLCGFRRPFANLFFCVGWRWSHAIIQQAVSYILLILSWQSEWIVISVLRYTKIRINRNGIFIIIYVCSIECGHDEVMTHRSQRTIQEQQQQQQIKPDKNVGEKTKKKIWHSTARTAQRRTCKHFAATLVFPRKTELTTAEPETFKLLFGYFLLFFFARFAFWFSIPVNGVSYVEDVLPSNST